MRLKVKICGLTRLEDARLALSLGAAELGFILAPSPRRIEPEALAPLLAELRGGAGPRPFRAIGVFVNEDAAAMRDIMSFAGLDAAQIHGDEDPASLSALPFPWYRALRIGSVHDAQRLLGEGWDCPRILVDAAARGVYGGSGGSIGIWAAKAARALAREKGKEFFLAGGLRPRNVASYIYSVAPDGLDVSSGVEEAPGKKSPEKLEALFREIREAEKQRAAEEDHAKA
jgi:phosphoribosylanthranilate isomerase